MEEEKDGQNENDETDVLKEHSLKNMLSEQKHKYVPSKYFKVVRES